MPSAPSAPPLPLAPARNGLASARFRDQGLVCSDQGGDLLPLAEEFAAVDLGGDRGVDDRVAAAGLLVAPDPLQRILLPEAARAPDRDEQVELPPEPVPLKSTAEGRGWKFSRAVNP